MKKILFVSVFCAIVIFSHQGICQVRLPRLISDGMVLQRNAPVKIWGWASPGEKVAVSFNGKTETAESSPAGSWEVTFSPMKAGGPFTMDISASNHIAVKDILVGDVWICSGQSNMELTMKRVAPLYEDIISHANNPGIRYLDVPDHYNFNYPEKDMESGSWRAVTPGAILDFSAVAYFFADQLYQKYKIPVGLVNASLGGSPVEAWMSEDALKKFPSIFAEAQRFKDSALIHQIEDHDQSVSKLWYQQLRQRDEGYKNPDAPWYDPQTDASQWDVMKVPGFWADEKTGAVNGVVWFRKEIDLPASMAGQPAKLLLGRIVDSDSVYINGVFVGTTGYQYPPRRYNVPSGLLKEGKNILVVRIISNSGRGGFVTDKPYQLSANGKTIDLKGEWRYKLGAVMEPLPGQTFIRWKPLGLYNGMIAPLLNLSIKGVIWYQGESNASSADDYDELFSAMIKDWREKWEQGSFPFIYVQLPNFMEPENQPGESDWAELREAQLKTLAVPNTAMAVAIDLGEWNDIHPLNKKDVGKRLALAARHVAYDDKNVVYSGPVYQSIKIKGNKIIVSFTNVGSGLVAKNGEPLKYFAIAGPDKKFAWAKAKIEGDKVMVWNEDISNPVAVRYAWADNPEGANLYNKEGLPASPFRTDR